MKYVYAIAIALSFAWFIFWYLYLPCDVARSAAFTINQIPLRCLNISNPK